MKVQEICIGDYVRVKDFFQYSGQYIKVVNIIGENVNAVFDDSGRMIFSGIPVSELEGITVNSEIINAIHLEDDFAITYDPLFATVTKWSRDSFGILHAVSTIKSCFYLHTLQHALTYYGENMNELDSIFLNRNKLLSE